MSENTETRKMLVGKAALTVVRHRDGTRSNVPAGRAVPASVDPLDAARLLDEGFLEEIELLAEVTDGDTAETEAETEEADDYPTWADKPRPDGWEDFTDEEKLAYVYGTGDPDADADAAQDAGMTDEEIATLLEGTAAEVMAEVGDNAALAERVLDAETQGGTVEGRKGLTADLRGVIEDGGQ
jgi:hypothetical protein